MNEFSLQLKGPDFLCIGLQKAGTRTLHQVLSLDSRCWMPLVKEFHHFDRGQIHKRHERFFPLIEMLKSGGQELAVKNRQRVEKGLRPLDELDLHFLLKSQKYLENGCRDDDYLDLFSVKPPNKIVGDITPGYSRLEEGEIAKINRLLPKAKLILIIRDPIARAWSMINMRLRKRLGIKRKMSLEKAQGMMLEAMATPVGQDLVNKVVNSKPTNSFPSKIYETWAGVYGSENIKVFSLEELSKMPSVVSDEICDMVMWRDQVDTGAQYKLEKVLTPKPNQSLEVAPNSKQNDPKIPLDTASKLLLVDAFEEEVRRCYKIFGERAEGWARKYEIELSA